ncbi:hypothetical protein [uncultured Haemophilus sp.]|uniref:hypothetical protein n=1 Tax=uncultured Haemophilus sp. TaxID=237779 RepID=UPI002587B884|nr:hypothetical protein [uncultured Haemophilus sp.]
MSFLKKNLIALIALFISIAIPIWQHFYDNTKVIREHKYEVLPTIKDIFSKYSLYQRELSSENILSNEEIERENRVYCEEEHKLDQNRAVQDCINDNSDNVNGLKHISFKLKYLELNGLEANQLNSYRATLETTLKKLEIFINDSKYKNITSTFLDKIEKVNKNLLYLKSNSCNVKIKDGHILYHNTEQDPLCSREGKNLDEYSKIYKDTIILFNELNTEYNNLELYLILN